MSEGRITVGAMMVSRNHKLLDITIPDLLGRCAWILLLVDNASKEVEEKVYSFQRRYYDRIFVRKSSMPNRLITRNGGELSYRKRCKQIKGWIREDVFLSLRRILDWKKPGYDKIDVLLWPDDDQVFTDYLPELLDKFWESEYKAISMLPMEVVGDMKTIQKTAMGHHVHILKYSRDFHGDPWRHFALYHPLEPRDVMRVEYYSVHMAYLTEENRQWRSENWKTFDITKSDLWKLPNKAQQMQPQEVVTILKRLPDKLA